MNRIPGFYGKFAFIPCFEPSNQQEAYDMVFDAFELSEKYKLPVLMRITTRLAHSRASVEQVKYPVPEKELHLPAESDTVRTSSCTGKKRSIKHCCLLMSQYGMT